jgi:hypothetical protein
MEKRSFIDQVNDPNQKTKGKVEDLNAPMGVGMETKRYSVPEIIYGKQKT